jgi:hypothetical protein
MGNPHRFAWPAGSGRVPLLLKLALTAFVAVLVPVYWVQYGPTNFLYFCDMALLLSLVAVWTEWPLPAGMAAVGITVPQVLWWADMLVALCGGRLTGMTAYMFKDNGNPEILFLHALSLFHGWLPFLVVYLVWRLGYDRRALAAWLVLAWTAMLVSYLWLPAPPPPADNPNLPVNIDYVFGLGDDAPQQAMSPRAWLVFVLVAFPVVLWVPMHLLLRRLVRPAAR